MRRVRQLVKSGIEGGITLTGAAALARHLKRDRVAILAYHNVVPDAAAGAGDASLHMPFSRFLRQLDMLERTHAVVPLESALDRENDRIRAVITFDDAYRGAVNLALPELRRRGLPATMFVCPGLLAEPGVWWDELAASGRLDAAARHHCMYALKGDLASVRKWGLTEAGAPPLPDSYGIATELELRDQLGAGITAGAHSWKHACLPALDPEELRADLERTLAWIEAFPGPTVRWLALPYGEGSPGVTETALEVGFQGVLRIRGGLCLPAADRGAVPRINVPAGMSSRGLVLRASGLLK